MTIQDRSRELSATPEEELYARINLLEQQQALFTQALVAALEGRWTGADSVEAYVYALNPTLQGTLTLDPPYVPPPGADAP